MRVSPSEQGERMRELGAEALRHWELHDPEIELVEIRENAVFRITISDGTRYALRIHRHGYHTPAALRSELEWIRALDENGIEAPQVVPAASGELFVTVESAAVPEPRQVDLFEWIEGEQLAAAVDHLDDETAVAGLYRRVGELAARVHNHAVAWPLPPNFERHAWDVEGLTGEQPLWGRFWELEALSSSQRELIERARKQVRAELLAYGQSETNYSLIHADMGPENVLVDGDCVRLIDFDDAGFGWHLFEIATTASVHRSAENLDRVLDPVVAGYRAHRPLPDEELERLPVFLLARGLINLAWVATRQETVTAKCEGGDQIANVCRYAERYLSTVKRKSK